ncbi:acyl-CoA thioester hydrolase [Amycolatopsis pretoriensis]|uniref:Acyl-CoA thioester hydrolase n=1 Tax=Amycolatopsis pretoriensis TaxID=218821 RepID=A0A1H5RDY4_9PSEU|nr:acyl-CoA thioesterase [Amycolatopsis pretoriensis]SEF36576.1 acyl-CoA thioester hydrolase [Amycolatopsis pretoriensis]
MTDREPFRTRIKVRHYELDTLGHLNHAVYHSYGEVSRLELLEAAGAIEGLRGLASVLLETHVVFRRELRAGDEVDVTCDVKFGSGKTFSMDSNIYKVDGTLAAEITCTLGLMDLELRKLVADPRGRYEAAGADLKLMSTAE